MNGATHASVPCTMHTALLATFLMLSTQGHAKKPRPPAPPPAPAAPVEPAPPAPPSPADGRWSRCPRDVNRSFGELERTLRELGESVDAVSDRRERRRLRDDLDHTIRLTERARDAACDAATAAPPPPTVIVAPPPPPPEPIVLSAAAFAELKEAVERESFDDGKARVIGLAIRGDICVTVDQTRQLMALHSFSDAQINTVKALAPRFVDPERAFTLQEALKFSTDKDRLTKTLKSASQLPVCRVP
jgi:hypothetical protein